MSVSAYALATRNHLRFYLSNFYGNDLEAKQRDCKVMLDEHPTADCGQEFISIYGAYHKAHTPNPMQAIDEEFGLTISVARKIALIPPDYRGELGYLSTYPTYLDISYGEDDNDRFVAGWASVEQRCREIVGLCCGKKRYELMHSANAYLTDNNIVGTGVGFTEPLIWQNTTPVPNAVGPEFFWGYQGDMPQDADKIFGLVMKVNLVGAVRIQSVDDFDIQLTEEELEEE